MSNLEEQPCFADVNWPLPVAPTYAVGDTHPKHASTQSTATPTAVLDLDFHLSEEWNLACRVAASRGLSKSSLLPRFLLYICEQTLTGSTRLLTEQRIGAAIFNRPPDYNPGEDNIVRSYARTLRRRLDDYFETDGQSETIRIVVPRGGYVPVFERRLEDPAPHIAPQHQMESPAPLSSNPIPAPIVDSAPIGPIQTTTSNLTASRLPWRAVCVGMLVGVAITSVLWFSLQALRTRWSQPASQPIWSQLFQQNRNTIIVPADSGLGIVQNLTGHLVPLEDYANGSYSSDIRQVAGVDAASLADLRQQRYTSVVDLNIANRLLQLSDRTTGRTETRFARSITTEDLKASNVILLGSSHTNPWVSLFADKLNFRLQYTPQVNRSFVENQQPRGTEQKQYANDTGKTENQTYGVVDFLPNLEGNGHVLIVQGLNMAATQAASDTLFNDSAMQPVVKQATRPDGSLRPFEILIQTTSIGATDPDSHIIATRFYP